jgi:hypothetical protein
VLSHPNRRNWSCCNEQRSGRRAPSCSDYARWRLGTDVPRGSSRMSFRRQLGQLHHHADLADVSSRLKVQEGGI